MTDVAPNRAALLAWVERLEFGQDVQGHGSLCQVYPDGTKKMCCLGVVTEQVADLLGLETSKIPDLRDHDGKRYQGVLWNGQGATLPRDVRDHLGVRDGNFNVTDPSDGQRRPIASVNDRGATFTELASMIRKEFDL